MRKPSGSGRYGLDLFCRPRRSIIRTYSYACHRRMKYGESKPSPRQSLHAVGGLQDPRRLGGGGRGDRRHRLRRPERRAEVRRRQGTPHPSREDRGRCRRATRLCPLRREDHRVSTTDGGTFGSFRRSRPRALREPRLDRGEVESNRRSRTQIRDLLCVCETGSEGLPGLHPLAVASDDVGFIGVDGVCACAAAHGVLDGGDIPRLNDVAAAASVEAVNRSIAALPDQVVRAPVAVDGVPSGPVADLVDGPPSTRSAPPPPLSWSSPPRPEICSAFPVPEMMSTSSVSVIET